MRSSLRAGLCVAAVLLANPRGASAQTPDLAALQQQIDQLREQLDALQQQLVQAAAGQGQTLPAPVQPPTGAPPAAVTVPAVQGDAGSQAGTLPTYGAATAASKIFNPDIAVIGNVLGAAGRNTVNPLPAFEMREAEASFQAVVDPYARADIFLAFGEEGVDLEEGFVTFPTLPAGLLVKAGRLRSAFGKVNTFHTHMSPWTDRPLVSTSLLNGEEGISDAGASVARLIPNPWMFLEATGQVFRGDAGEVFRSSSRGDLAYVGHMRGYRDITESTNIDLGVSYARGHNASGRVDDIDLGRFTTQLTGLDATLRWRPLQRSIYRSFVGRSEFVWSRRQQPGGRQLSAGFYVSGDYQFGRRWFAGARLDRSQRAENPLRDTGGSLLLTYWPSEFSQLRAQYRRTRYADAATANELLFQLQFSIGVHGAHPF